MTVKIPLRITQFGKNNWRVWVNGSISGYVKKVVIKQRGHNINMYEAFNLRNRKLGTPYYTLKSAAKRVEQESQ